MRRPPRWSIIGFRLPLWVGSSGSTPCILEPGHRKERPTLRRMIVGFDSLFLRARYGSLAAYRPFGF